jgi:hypothetical protein
MAMSKCLRTLYLLATWPTRRPILAAPLSRPADTIAATLSSSRVVAGRSAFLTGQHIIRTGLSKVGFPGAPMGRSFRHQWRERGFHQAGKGSEEMRATPGIAPAPAGLTEPLNS